jgi:hypothetical protein
LPYKQNKSCDVIDQEILPGGGVRFSRTNYGNEEEALISFSGPAVVTVNHFSTEQGYDHLNIGSQTLSGEVEKPRAIDIPAGRASILWSSDFSVSGGSWSLDIVQSMTEAEIVIPQGTKHVADVLEVVSAYGRYELADGVIVEVNDSEYSYYYDDYHYSSEALPLSTDVNTKTHLRGSALRVGLAPAAAKGQTGDEHKVELAPAAANGQTGGENKNAHSSQMTLLPFAASRYSAEASLRGTVSVAGWRPQGPDVSAPLLQRLSRVIAAALGDEEQVHLGVNVLQVGAASAVEVDKPTDSTIIDFEVVAEEKSFRGVLDDVEARLIMLAMGGKALKRFDQLLTARLRAGGAATVVAAAGTKSSFSDAFEVSAPNEA